MDVSLVRHQYGKHADLEAIMQRMVSGVPSQLIQEPVSPEADF